MAMSVRKTRLLRFGMLAIVLGLVAWGVPIMNGRGQTNGQPRTGNNSSPLVPRMAAPVGGQSSGGHRQSGRVPAGNAQELRVGQATRNDVSPPLRDVKPIAPKPWTKVRERPEPREKSANTQPQNVVNDPLVQRSFGALTMPAPVINFDGLPN